MGRRLPYAGAMRFAIGTLVALLGMALCACGDDIDRDPGTGGGGGTTATGTSTGTTPSGDEYQLCVDTINQYRATLSLPPLARWTDAEACANGQAQSDSETGEPHGAFQACGEWAQNECPGWPGPPASLIVGCLDMMWDEGPGGGHYENMRGDYSRVACGFYQTPQGDYWALQDFQ